MIRVDRAAACALAVAGLVGVGGCGSSSGGGAVTGPAVRSLAPLPASVPADYTTVAAIEAQLDGVAQCTANGPQSAVCTLLTTTTNTAQIATITPFQVKVFATPALLQQYLVFVRGANAAYASTGTAKREILVGPHWVLTPQVDTSGLVETVQQYLGGTLSS